MHSGYAQRGWGQGPHSLCAQVQVAPPCPFRSIQRRPSLRSAARPRRTASASDARPSRGAEKLRRAADRAALAGRTSESLRAHGAADAGSSRANCSSRPCCPCDASRRRVRGTSAPLPRSRRRRHERDEVELTPAKPPKAQAVGAAEQRDGLVARVVERGGQHRGSREQRVREGGASVGERRVALGQGGPVRSARGRELGVCRARRAARTAWPRVPRAPRRRPRPSRG